MSRETYTKVKRIYFVIFVVFCTLIFGSEIFLKTYFKKEKEAATSINIAGRQRMLSQRISSFAFQYQVFSEDQLKIEIQKNIKELKESHQDLKVGNRERGIVPPLNQNISAMYQELDSVLLEIENEIDCVLQNCSSIKENLKSLKQHTEKWLDQMNKIVFISSELTTYKIQKFDRIHFYSTLIITLVLLFAFFRLLYPMHRHLIREAEFLSKKEETYELMESVASIGFWELDVLTKISTWSPEIYEIYGIEKGTSLTDVDGIKFYAEHERDRITQCVTNCIVEKERFDEEFEFIDSNGNEKWVRSIGLPVEDEEGNVKKLVGVFQDITNSKKQQNRIKEKQRYFELAIDGASLGIWDWDLRDNSVKFDSNWAKMLGYNLSEIEMNLDEWEKRVHPDDLEQCYADIKKYMDGESSHYENVHRMQHKNGEWVYILDKGRISEYDTDGNPIRFTGTHLDITEAKATQQELEMVLGHIDVGIWKWNVKEDKLHWDESMYKLYEVNRHNFKLSNESWRDMVLPEDREKASQAFYNALLNKKEFNHNLRIRTKNNQIKNISSLAKVDYDNDGNPHFVYGINIDRTNELEKQSLIEESERFLNETLDTMPAIFYAKDRETKKFIKVNKSYHDFFKTTDPEILGKDNQELFPKEIADLFDKVDAQVYREGRLIVAEEEAINAEGVKKQFHSYKFPYYDKDENVYALGGISIDVTAQKQLEEQLTHQAKFASIGQLAAGVGHEINNPLAIIKGYLSTIQNKHPEFSDDVKTKFEKIDLAVSRIKNIVSGLRAFSRDDGFEESDFDAIQLIEETIFMIEDIYSNEGVNIHIDNAVENLSGELYAVGNRGKFQQVIVNLLSNAKDATAEQDDRQIKIKLSFDGARLKIIIADNGKGVPTELRDKIFDPFFTTKEVGSGTGIGLSLSYQIMEEFKGHLKLGQPSKGAEFIIELPCREIAIQNENNSKNENRTPLDNKLTQNLSFLIAEDEEDLRDIIIDFLEENEFQYEAFEDGASALKAFQNEPDKFHIIISDMKMPGLDGPQFLKEVRKLGNGHLPYFYFMTGGINTNLDITEFEDRVDGIMFKPFDFDEIMDEIEKIAPDILHKVKHLAG